MENKKEIISYLDNISLFILGVLFIGFPLIITSLTTDPFGLPKQAVLILSLSIVLFAFGVKVLVEKSIRLRRTPFDLPVSLFILIVFISSLLAVNKAESLISFVPLLFGVLSFFVVVNTARENKSINFLKLSLLAGGVILSVLSILSFLKIYILPFDFAKTQTFTPIGSLLDQSIYLALVFVLALYPVVKAVKTTNKLSLFKGIKLAFSTASIILLLGLIISIYQLIAKNALVLLPYEVGFQTAFAAISQDAGRIAQGFFFGSGFGTYAADFSRFKQTTFNANNALWSLTFFKSSSFILELLATTGILGFFSFVYILYKALKEKPLYPALVLATIALFLLPFSFVNITLFFVLLGLLAAELGHLHSQKVFDVELQLVALKKGFISFEAPEERAKKSILLPAFFLILVVVFVLYTGIYSFNYVKASTLVQNSLIAASQNNGSLTYQKQAEAIAAFPNSDAYQRLFSQTNLALANNLYSQIPQDSSPSAETTQTIYTLIQQSINAGRTATALSPQSAINWQNLSSIYRSLIGSGQNADQFALLTAQQAVALDPNNPQQYINLGGIYYQLSAWDRAAQQFATAANLKPDFANAYYNLGHALEQEGDLKGALAQYQTVKTLIENDKENIKVITAEIDALEKKINGEQVEQAPVEEEAGSLKVNTPETQLPEQNPPLKIPAPEANVTPTPTEKSQENGITPTP